MVLVLPCSELARDGGSESSLRLSSGAETYKGGSMADWNTLNQFWRLRRAR
jgi:hypothetical protein